MSQQKIVTKEEKLQKARGYLRNVLRLIDERSFEQRKDLDEKAINRIKANMVYALCLIEAEKMQIPASSIGVVVSDREFPIGIDARTKLMNSDERRKSGKIAEIQFSREAFQDKDVFSLLYGTLVSLRSIKQTLDGKTYSGNISDDAFFEMGYDARKSQTREHMADKFAYEAEIYACDRLSMLIDDAVVHASEENLTNPSTLLSEVRRSILSSFKTRRKVEYLKANAIKSVQNLVGGESAKKSKQASCIYVLPSYYLTADSRVARRKNQEHADEIRASRSFIKNDIILNVLSGISRLSAQQKVVVADCMLSKLAKKNGLRVNSFEVQSASVNNKLGFGFNRVNSAEKPNLIGVLQLGETVLNIEDTRQFILAVENILKKVEGSAEFKNAINDIKLRNSALTKSATPIELI